MDVIRVPGEITVRGGIREEGNSAGSAFWWTGCGALIIWERMIGLI